MPDYIDKSESKERIVEDLLLLNFDKNDVKDIYKEFCDRYDIKIIEEGTEYRRKYGKRR